MLRTSRLQRKFQSPPRLNSPKSFTFSPSESRFAGARTSDRKSMKTAAMVAAGVGLAVGAVALFSGEPVAPAEDPGAYTLENPDVVVMDDSLDRIDLSRETDTQCSGTGEDEVCVEVSRDYHRVGLHIGHGVVQDLNGNLFVAPQLAAPDAPGKAAVNPNSVDLEAPLFSEGHLKQTSPGHYEVSGSLFGFRHEIDINGNEARVTQRGLLGSFESMRIENDNGVVTVVEDGWSRQEIVQSQGDHLLIQGQWGGKYGEIRHNPEAGEYSLTRPSLFSNWEYNVSYSPEQYTRSSNTGASTVSATSNGDGSTTTQLGWLQGGYDSNDTSTGWTTKAHGLLSGTYTYTVDGGR